MASHHSAFCFMHLLRLADKCGMRTQGRLEEGLREFLQLLPLSPQHLIAHARTVPGGKDFFLPVPRPPRAPFRHNGQIAPVDEPFDISALQQSLGIVPANGRPAMVNAANMVASMSTVGYCSLDNTFDYLFAKPGTTLTKLHKRVLNKLDVIG